MTAELDRPFVVDHVIVVCKGCQSERRFNFDPPMRSAKEFIAWQSKPGNVPRCACGAATCDMKRHIADQN